MSAQLFEIDRAPAHERTLVDASYQLRSEDAWHATVALRQCVRLLDMGDDQRAARWFASAVWWWELAGGRLHAATADEEAWFCQNISEGWWQE